MSLNSLLLSIFKSFSDIFRDETADRLENGDVGNETFRDSFKRDLQNIKAKLDNPSKIDICSSLDHLEEGLVLFFKCFNEVERNGECEETSNFESQATCTATTSSFELSSAVKHPSVFKLAKDLFKKSREEATRVFNNKNLSLKDRIFAVNVKVIAQIFECPEHPKNAIDLCLSYIKRLHQLDSVQEMFVVSIGGGSRAMFNRSETMKNMKSVIHLNHQLYQFTVRIKNNHDLVTWPCIELGEGKVFNPIRDWRKILTSEESSKEMERMKAAMFQTLEKMNINEEPVELLPSAIKEMVSTVRSDILIAGGFSYSSIKRIEIFSWKFEEWFEMAPMKKEHRCSSSFIYNDDLFVVGGVDCNSIYILNFSQSTLTWKKFPGELPYECCGHKTVVCKQQILLIGGVHNKTRSDIISELKITGTTSHVLKELCHMPEARSNHAAEVIDDKVVIFGGREKDNKALSRVLEFDPATRTFKEMPPLPHPLTEMATVRWRDQVVLLGGYDGKEILNSVIMYDRKTGNITVLPSMLERRSSCCAVITGDTIVVIGGQNDKDTHLNSVECFKMGRSSSWTYLPPLNEPRYAAIAEVLPV
ncbi:influenza virus NS1A-binding protein-like [Xenia sp. Carnegie-2017]|uniref:influenza virus NS1A-binding protein-like n=1 Tax=Xenia sp. Carnegie-2017 TaxID=2897299 RepID=UPI001F03C05C|nr:influenza virus NS1A-binding protein-like [Xenia sp. Carnegie-2017]